MSVRASERRVLNGRVLGQRHTRTRARARALQPPRYRRALALRLLPPASHSLSYAANLRVYETATGTQVGALFHRGGAASDEWPALQWTGDESLVCRMTSTGLALMHGATLQTADTGARVPAAARYWVSPGVPGAGRRASVVTFVPRTKSKPAAVCLWSLPPAPAPIASRSLQSDACRVEFNCNGTAVLVELSTATSATSY